MSRYFFELMDDNDMPLEAFIPDGSSKEAAVRKSKNWMQANGVSHAQLAVNSLRTSNVLDILEINI